MSVIMRVPSNPLALIGPAILLVFAVSFAAVWARDRRHQHLLFLGAACLLFCAGALSQILAIPDGDGVNAVTSALIYTVSVLLLSDGLLRRSGARLPWVSYLIVPLLIVGGIAYFYYIDRRLIVRIYLLNFGYGLIFLATAWRLRQLRIGRLSERILFWVLTVFSLHFFPRTVLTVGATAPAAGSFGSSPFWLTLQFSLAVSGVALALAVLAVTVGDMIEKLRHERSTDHLTGLSNRLGFEEAADRLLHDARAWPVCLVVADIDRFKSINDTFGHPAGDAVLRAFAKLLKENARKIDLCGRLGGEEFAVLLPNCDIPGGYAFADRLRSVVRQTRFEGLPRSRCVTASFGLAAAGRGEGLSSLVARADKALYQAKRSGRNRVEINPESLIMPAPASTSS
jgi:diguanylate cyclase (GGDEF)-like protein